jgi:hypothetical protein
MTRVTKLVTGPAVPWALLCIGAAVWYLRTNPYPSYVCFADVTNATGSPLVVVAASLRTDEVASHRLLAGGRQRFRCMAVGDTTEDVGAWPVCMWAVNEGGEPVSSLTLDFDALQSTERVVIGPDAGQFELRPRSRAPHDGGGDTP